jgi:proteic killer suppression protein
VIQSFFDKATADIFAGKKTKANRAAHAIWCVARRKLGYLDAATRLQDLGSPPGNALEKLKHARVDQYSIRINDQYRLCFTWTEAGPARVEFTDYH